MEKFTFSILVLFLLSIFSSCTKTKTDNTAEKNGILKESKGTYLDYDYTYADYGNKVAVLFYPKFLPRNDEIVVGAIKRIISDAYRTSVSSEASTENKNGTNVIKLSNNKTNYYTILVKEDTGEIHSFVLWGEDK